MGCLALRVYAESCLALHRFMRAANILVRSPPSPFSEFPKSAPGDSKSVSEGRKSSIEYFGGSKSSQDESKSAPRARQERPKSAPRAPRAPQKLFNTPPRTPKCAPRAPKWALRVLPRRRGEFLGIILRPPISTKAPFASDLSRDALKSGFWKKFSTIFRLCAQATNLISTRK